MDDFLDWLKIDFVVFLRLVVVGKCVATFVYGPTPDGPPQHWFER